MTSTLEGRPARPDAEHTALIGRARELEALCAQFDRAARGAGGVALIHGEAGIGKTRLAVEFDRVAHGHGATCWFAHAETASGPPYAFWLELLKGAVEGSGDPSRWLELRSYLDELGRQARWLSQPGAAFAALGKHGLGVIDAMGEPALQLIAAACRDAPLVVTIDDAQSLAGTDVELLGRLAARTTRLPALIVLACRDDAPGTAPALESLLARLTQARLLRRYPLGGFGASEVAAYLRERMGTAPSAALAEAVLRRTEGNPFFLAEVATLLMHDPRAAEPVVAVSLLPDSVRDVLQVRLAQLTRPCRELLAAAAVIGEEFDHGVLAGAVGAGAVGDVGAALEEALARRVIVVGSSGGAYRFAHSLTRDTILEQLSPLRRAELHGRAAGALAAALPESLPRRPALLAHHYAASASVHPEHARPAIEQLRLAAARAEEFGQWDGAARCHEQVVALTETAGASATAAERVRALQAAGRCWMLAGEVRSAWRLLMQAREVARLAGEDELGAEATLVALEGIDAPRERAIRLAREALASRRLSARLRARLQVQLARAESGARARAAVTAARALARRHALPDVEVQLRERDYHDAVARGEMERARSALEAHAEWSRERGDRVAYARDRARIAETATRAGALREGWALASKALGVALAERVRPTADFCRSLLMSIALARGDLDAYEFFAREVAERPVAQQLRARRAELAGELASARAALRTAGPTAEHPRIAWDLSGALARLATRGGDLRRARGELAAWASRREGSEYAPDRQDAVAVVGEALVRHGERALVASVLAESERWQAVRFIFMAATGLDRIRGQLALRLGAREAAVAYFERALRWAEDEALPGERAQALLGLAVTGRDPVAERAAAIAEAERLARAPGLALLLDDVAAARSAIGDVAAPGAGAPISAREREVLRLVSAGRTNREIAVALRISRHTVARHVSNALSKLGAANRAEAATVALRAGYLSD